MKRIPTDLPDNHPDNPNLTVEEEQLMYGPRGHEPQLTQHQDPERERFAPLADCFPPQPECPGVVPRVDAILAEMDAREWRQEEAERYAHPAERPARNQPN